MDTKADTGRKTHVWYIGVTLNTPLRANVLMEEQGEKQLDSGPEPDCGGPCIDGGRTRLALVQ